MRVGLNLIYLVPGHTGGMEIYARELIRALRQERPDLELTAFVGKEAAGWPDGVKTVVVPVNSSNRVQWVLGEQLHLPRLAQREGVELVHSLATTGPGRGAFKRVATVHDLIYRIHPEAHFGVISMGMRVLVPLSVKRATRVIAVSRSTGDDLQRLMKVDPARIDVVPNGVGTPPSLAPMPASELRMRHGLGERPFVLCMSAKRPHKNLPRLLDALAAIPAERRPVAVLCGYPTEHEEQLVEQAGRLGISDDVRILGWVDDAELEGLYAAAACLVFPSLYEGFGLPVLEAMARGLPVACSNRSSLPEIAGDAALLFDPENVASIAAAIERLLTDPEERERLIARGHEQASRFTWTECARGTLASYERALS
jgi:glycosyltransferase involved in cell wall biosynthesis